MRIIPIDAKIIMLTKAYKKIVLDGKEKLGDLSTKSSFFGKPKKNIEIEDRKIKTPIRANNNFGSTLSPKQKLASNAPNIDPTEKQDLKIGFNIFFVFDSNIAICVKRLGAVSYTHLTLPTICSV